MHLLQGGGLNGEVGNDAGDSSREKEGSGKERGVHRVRVGGRGCAERWSGSGHGRRRGKEEMRNAEHLLGLIDNRFTRHILIEVVAIRCQAGLATPCM